MADGEAHSLQVVHIPAGLGIDQGTREEIVQPGTANLLNENVRITRRGALGKRYGYTALTTLRLDGTSRTTGWKLFPFGEQLGIIDGHLLDLYDSISSRNVTRDRVPECGPVERVILPYPGQAILFDSAVTSNGYLIAGTVIQVGSNLQLQVSVLNAATDELVRTDIILSSIPGTGWAGVTVIGTKAIVVYTSSTTTIKCQVLDCSSASGLNTGWGAAQTIATDRLDSLAFDTTPFADRFAIVYVNSSGGASQISIKTVDATGAILESATNSTSSVTPAVCSCAGNDGDTLWVSWNQTTSNFVLGLSPTSLATVIATAANQVAITPTQHALTATTTQKCCLVIATGSTGATQVVAQSVLISGGGAAAPDGTPRNWPNVTGATKPWYTGGHIYCVVAPQDRVNGNNTQQNMIVVDVGEDSTTLRPVATIAPRLSPINRGTQHCSLVSGQRFVFLNAVQRTSLSSGTAVGSTGPSIEATYLDFASSARWESVQYNGNVYLTGGITTYLDGQLVRESEFVTRPDQPTTSFSGTGISDTTIKYVAVLESVDASGNIEWSAVSDPSAPVTPVNQGVVVTLSQLLITSRYDTSSPSNVIRIAVYRTSNSTGNLIYYRAGVVANASNSISTTFTDTMPTATLLTQAQLYKQPGVPGTAQDRYCPPGLADLVAYNGMLVGVGDDGYSIWFSAQQVIGEATWWNPIFQFPITDEGPITAVAVMDGVLFIFKRRAIYEVTGAAPSDNAAQGGFGTPSLISSNAGCREPRSVCVTNIGLFFLSDRGWEVLVRGGQSTEWVGEQVRSVVDDFPVCTAATLDFVNERVYFEMAAAETNGQVSGAGRTLVYNLTLKTWESVDRRTSLAGVADKPAQSAAMVFVNGAYRYAWLDTSGVVYFEDPTTYLDAAQWVTASYEIPWVKMGLQQQQNVYGGMFLLENESAAGLQIEFANRYGDYDPKFTKAWTEDDMAGQRQIDMRPDLTNWAFKARISDVAPATLGSGQGHTFIGLSFDIVPQNAATKGTPHIAEAVRR